MREGDDMTMMEFSIGDELLDAITEAGRTKALPMTFTEDQGSQVVNQPVDEVIDFPKKGPPLRLVR